MPRWNIRTVFSQAMSRFNWPKLLSFSSVGHVDTVRNQRTKKFLQVHLILCLMGLVNALFETILGLQPDAKRQIYSWLASGVPALWTIFAFSFYKKNKYISYLIPVILSLDSILMMLQTFQEATFETAWIATPILLIILMPIFSDKRKFVWILAGVQSLVYLVLVYVRYLGLLDYQIRSTDPFHDFNFQIFSWMGFVIASFSTAFLAGTASVDVVNSQVQLQNVLTEQEIALKRAQQRIVQQEKMASIGQLTAGIAHGINNPLTFVRTNLTSLQRDFSGFMNLIETFEEAVPLLEREKPELARRLSSIRNELCLDDPREIIEELISDSVDGVDVVQDIIQNLKVFSRLDEAARKEIDLREGIESTLKILNHRIEGRNLKIALNLEPIPKLDGYPALLNQVFMNLLQNACDALSGKGSLIRVSTFQRDDAIIVEIADDGPGVKPELRARIFDPFFTTKDVGEGTGLGLSLSCRIVEKHGGVLSVGDAPEGGALFIVVLPLMAPLEPPTEEGLVILKE